MWSGMWHARRIPISASFTGTFMLPPSHLHTRPQASTSTHDQLFGRAVALRAGLCLAHVGSVARGAAVLPVSPRVRVPSSTERLLFESRPRLLAAHSHNTQDRPVPAHIQSQPHDRTSKVMHAWARESLRTCGPCRNATPSTSHVTTRGSNKLAVVPQRSAPREYPNLVEWFITPPRCAFSLFSPLHNNQRAYPRAPRRAASSVLCADACLPARRDRARVTPRFCIPPRHPSLPSLRPTDA
jgi:hypothetical protein